MKPDAPTLHIFCPLDSSQLLDNGDGIQCRRCRRHLPDLSDGKPQPPNTSCAIVKRIAAPLVGTSMLLSSCSVDSGSQSDGAGNKDPRPPSHPAEGEHREQLVVGMIAPPGPHHDDQQYPTATRTNEKGIVISPYSGEKVDVRDCGGATLVLDPKFRMEDRKFFRIPDANEK